MFSRRRDGFTLVEMLIALTLTAVIGSVLVTLFVNQSQFVDHQERMSDARAVSRSAINIIMSEMRMAEGPNAVAAASETSVTLRIPYAIGLVCGNTLTRTVAMMLPVDSTVWVQGQNGFSGWAYRTSFAPDGGYVRVSTLADVGSATGTAAARCGPTAANISIPNGNMVTLSPVQVALQPGQNVYLYQHVRYEFRESTSVPGQIGLYRQVVAANQEEELVAPFDEGARFAFFDIASEEFTTTVPALADIRGIHLMLNARSERPSASGQPRVADLSTAVFFQNRID